jgi:hypothetical protein
MISWEKTGLRPFANIQFRDRFQCFWIVPFETPKNVAITEGGTLSFLCEMTYLLFDTPILNSTNAKAIDGAVMFLIPEITQNDRPKCHHEISNRTNIRFPHGDAIHFLAGFGDSSSRKYLDSLKFLRSECSMASFVNDHAMIKAVFQDWHSFISIDLWRLESLTSFSLDVLEVCP